ncbi:DUF58 domain-containing protein [Sinorhizobium meliloti]|uniref:DUF58 domain-containing protein n=1 Tax=Rhizobium meliloti TaxID=382 RepID=UPI000FD51F8A|nr:DUF58 domain-containing protein [Sinorhizobium meliloti]RVM46291.1 DUF58 domain-containing protein [Sinorhizobium meliloti]RVN65774.1 DUF58 domain-containing protein [Sinorhizobium meliloti]RVR05604.1 DUF58 domain-containing protein [Sinorhizobium meliloti]
MAISLPAFGRTKEILRRAAGDTDGAYVSVDNLVALESIASDLTFLRKAPVRRFLAGRHESRMRGRGLSFEELRTYMPGDDIRTIDWRVTARTGQPFVRVYNEEKDRPALILVDQRTNMFFGSRRSMKSVAAAEVAALCAWRVMALGDRVGGVVFNDLEQEAIRPHRSRGAVIRFAETISIQNNALSAGSDIERSPGQLNAVLGKVAALARHDHLIIVVSDFDGHGPATRDLLLRMSVANDVIAVLVYDPFLLDLPRQGEMVVSGGALQAELQFGRSNVREAVDSFARNRGRELLSWQEEMGLPMLPVSAAEEVAPQLRTLLGQLAWRQRRR